MTEGDVELTRVLERRGAALQEWRTLASRTKCRRGSARAVRKARTLASAIGHEPSDEKGSCEAASYRADDE